MNRFHFIAGLTAEDVDNEKMRKYYERFKKINPSTDPIAFEGLLMDIIEASNPLGRDEIKKIVLREARTPSVQQKLIDALIELFKKKGFIEKTPAEKRLQQGIS